MWKWQKKFTINDVGKKAPSVNLETPRGQEIILIWKQEEVSILKTYQELLRNPNFIAALGELDKEEARKHQALGCRYCGGVLDRADYYRKARGVEVGNIQRINFCCRNCRRRSSPKSVVFLKHKVFAFAAVLLTLSYCAGGNGKRLSSACAVCGVSEVTLRRWRSWSERFLESQEWKVLRRKLSAMLSIARWPCSLIEESTRSDVSLYQAVLTSLATVSVLSIQYF